MNETMQNYEVLRTLNIIAEKTRSAPLTHGGKLILYVTLEVICYTFFLLLLLITFLLPNGATLGMQMSKMQMHIGIRMEALDGIMLGFKITLLVLSLFPLGMALLIMSSRRKSRKLYEVNKLVKGVIGEVVGI